ncbi:hypothetical protein ANN_17670 [Periplaneta americana]|uniref:PiggyBac transposable element-derived protein domain-containing protein n=1 Tax=Periplaneta americana TaxID=6978 RepID=A0ABQ8SUW4_PERAM|nr:hypothetical protein ANN_17670 [Periplaneta americana]
MLTLFRGRCPFKVFLKEKPAKYGFLIKLLADCDCQYVHSMDVYADKQEGTTPESREVVKRLVAPRKDTGRNVTTDRFYTSVKLAEDLTETITGRELHSSKFAFTDPASGKPPITVVSYIPKPKKNLIMLSSHQDAKVSEGGKKKSDMNLFYNSGKGSVDTIDQMARMYITKRGTRRWPLSVFYTLIDIACINSYTLYIMTFPDWYKKKTNRPRVYLQELGLQLLKPNVEHGAATIIGLQNNVIISMEAILEKEITKTTQNQQ